MSPLAGFWMQGGSNLLPLKGNHPHVTAEAVLFVDGEK